MSEATASLETAPVIELLARLPPDRRAAWLDRQTSEQLSALQYGWQGVRARPEQLPPSGDWDTWCYLAGRGAGKTRSMAEWFHSRAMSGKYRLGAIVAPTPADARDFCIEGESGLLNVGIPEDRPIYQTSTRSLEWRTGFRALIYSAEDPDQVRGPNVDTAWASELAAWPRHRLKDASEGRTKAQLAWNNLMFTLRVSDNPQCVIDTTPRPMEPLKTILRTPGTVVTRGTTYDNRANLAEKFYRRILQYEGTRLGRQEIGGEMIEDVEGALWHFDDFRPVEEQPDDISLVAVGVDPSGSAMGNEAGIVAAGCNMTRDRGCVLADRSGQLSPDQWAGRAIDLWRELDADCIVVERNFGGDMCRSVIEKQVALRGLLGHRVPRIVEVTASRGKRVRAEPIAMMYEKGLISHLVGLGTLEAELTSWDATDGSPSPNRLDAMVWALSWLMLGKSLPIAAPVGIVRTSPNRI